MSNRDNARLVTAALIGVASLCFPACGPEDMMEGDPPLVDPARNPDEDPTARAAHDGLAAAQPDPAERVWKVVRQSPPATDRRDPICVVPGAAAALPATANAPQFGATVEPALCRPGTTGRVPVTPLPAGDGDHVQLVQRD